MMVFYKDLIKMILEKLMSFIKKKLYILGSQAAKSDRYSIKTLQEGFGGFRDIVLNSSQEIFINIFTTHQKISRFKEFF